MATLLKFRNVSLFKGQPFGINDLSLEIERSRTYQIAVKSEEQLNTLAGIIEGRFRVDSGLIERQAKIFIQSDRLLLGDKVFPQEVKKWLALQNEFFQFGNKRRSKYGFVQILKAGHLTDYPIYKLGHEDKVKFCLLALAFQERGLILISRLLTQQLTDHLTDFLLRIIKESHATCCLLTTPQNNIDLLLSQIPELIKLNPGELNQT